MARKVGKNTEKARKQVEARPYRLAEAAEVLKKAHFAKFDETVELVVNLGVDPKHSDQMVRGTVVLPHGLGKSKRVLVIAGGEKVREAQDAGADFVGGEDMVQKIQEGWTDFEAVIATPDMMKSAGKLGKVLGPRGLMPNPKTGTVTFEVARAVKEIKAGKVEFRLDKTAIIHSPIGKISFDAAKLAENAQALIAAILKAKPAAAKGKFVKRVTLTSTMGPGILIDPAEVEAAVAVAAQRSRKMKKRSEKQQDLDQLKTALAKVSTVILTTFQGVKVEEDTKLRRAVQAAGGSYQVVKNTLAERAAAGTPAEPLLKNLTGPNSIAYTATDPVALAKVLTKVAKDVPAFRFKAGVVQGRVLSIEEIQQLAHLPSKDELISKIMFLLQAPAQRIATALAAVSRNLVVTLNEAVKADKFGAGGSGPDPVGTAQ